MAGAKAPRRGQYILVLEGQATLLSAHGLNGKATDEALRKREEEIYWGTRAAVAWFGSDGHLYSDIYGSIDDPREEEQRVSQMCLRWQEERS